MTETLPGIEGFWWDQLMKEHVKIQEHVVVMLLQAYLKPHGSRE